MSLLDITTFCSRRRTALAGFVPVAYLPRPRASHAENLTDTTGVGTDGIRNENPLYSHWLVKMSATASSPLNSLRAQRQSIVDDRPLTTSTVDQSLVTAKNAKSPVMPLAMVGIWSTIVCRTLEMRAAHIR